MAVFLKKSTFEELRMVDNLSEFELRPFGQKWWASPAKSWGFHGI